MSETGVAAPEVEAAEEPQAVHEGVHPVHVTPHNTPSFPRPFGVDFDRLAEEGALHAYQGVSGELEEHGSHEEPEPDQE